MIQTFADLAVAPQAFSSLNCLGRSVHAHPENIKRSEQQREIIRPTLLLHNVFN